MGMDQDEAPATKGDVNLVKGEMKAFMRKFSLEMVKIHASNEKRHDLIRAEIRAISSNLTKQIDGYMSQVGKIDRAQIIADWRVTQLEGRVAKIEPRPS
jgi:hypothetical protein